MRDGLIIILLLLVAVTATAQTTPSKKTPADVMREIRLKVLTTPASQLGRKPTEEFPHVHGIIMDWPIEDTILSLMASSAGDGSIYTTGDFGVLGGIKYENVRNAAKSFVKLGEKYYSDATPAKDYPYPQKGHVCFYLMCYDDVRMIDTDVNSLSKSNGKYSDLFAQAQRMISELRQIAQQPKK
ncbi:MAG TPA: hypothetical protein VLK27_12720 [Chthoniobacterales bacterium]|nr:hypothetical protein [Chthoniobacterales bacterium]